MFYATTSTTKSSNVLWEQETTTGWREQLAVSELRRPDPIGREESAANKVNLFSSSSLLTAKVAVLGVAAPNACW